MDPIDGKFTAFGWKTQVINGNDMREVLKAFERARAVEGQPTCIVSPHAQGPRNPQPAAQAGRHQFPRQARAGKDTWTRPSPKSPSGVANKTVCKKGDHSWRELPPRLTDETRAGQGDPRCLRTGP